MPLPTGSVNRLLLTLMPSTPKPLALSWMSVCGPISTWPPLIMSTACRVDGVEVITVAPGRRSTRVPTLVEDTAGWVLVARSSVPGVTSHVPAASAIRADTTTQVSARADGANPSAAPSAIANRVPCVALLGMTVPCHGAAHGRLAWATMVLRRRSGVPPFVGRHHQ